MAGQGRGRGRAGEGQVRGQTWRMTAAARGVVGVRVAEEDSMGSALAEEAMAFRAA